MEHRTYLFTKTEFRVNATVTKSDDEHVVVPFQNLQNYDEICVEQLHFQLQLDHQFIHRCADRPNHIPNVLYSASRVST